MANKIHETDPIESLELRIATLRDNILGKCEGLAFKGTEGFDPNEENLCDIDREMAELYNEFDLIRDVVAQIQTDASAIVWKYVDGQETDGQVLDNIIDFLQLKEPEKGAELELHGKTEDQLILDNPMSHYDAVQFLCSFVLDGTISLEKASAAVLTIRDFDSLHKSNCTRIFGLTQALGDARRENASLESANVDVIAELVDVRADLNESERIRANRDIQNAELTKANALLSESLNESRKMRGDRDAQIVELRAKITKLEDNAMLLCNQHTHAEKVCDDRDAQIVELKDQVEQSKQGHCLGCAELSAELVEANLRAKVVRKGFEEDVFLHTSYHINVDGKHGDTGTRDSSFDQMMEYILRLNVEEVDTVRVLMEDHTLPLWTCTNHDYR